MGPRVTKLYRGKLQPHEVVSFYGNPKEKRPVVAQFGVYRVIVDKIARVVEDGLAAVHLHPLEDVCAASVIDVYTPVYDGAGEPAEDPLWPQHPVRAQWFENTIVSAPIARRLDTAPSTRRSTSGLEETGR
jgi:hypothetical protein